ncbi:hypothetical protein DVK07_20305 [Halorubrum sp. Atlit-26R]|nr:hypothetical protein DVK07_20305 [Halorubrum sp. Atlit-26R]
MGDGSVPKTNDGAHGLFRLPMVNKQFLEWFDHEMGILSTGVSLKKTAAELARNNRESGFSPNARAENYHDMYTVISRSHPFMRSLRRWYRSGEKRFPESLSLTPRIAKMWYVCDGYLDVQEYGEPRAAIRIRHRDDRQEFLLNYSRTSASHRRTAAKRSASGSTRLARSSTGWATHRPALSTSGYSTRESATIA